MSHAQGESNRDLELRGYVGFDSLPDQLVNHRNKDGYEFNILCVGETGLGKSTLMDSLFKTDFESDESDHWKKSVGVASNTYDLEEKGVRLRLTIVDSVGFGDQINRQDSFKPIVDHINSKFEEYLQEEVKAVRNNRTIVDRRIHACLYFIAPTGHSLKSLDLVAMRALADKVNVIPVIAKSDCITASDLADFKKRILEEIEDNRIPIYRFPEDDDEVADLNAKLNSFIPFAVVGSRKEIKMGNQSVRVRQYPWGLVEVENENHCDFVRLREMLLRTNMEDLINTTQEKHYETFRMRRLSEMGYLDKNNQSIQEAFEKKRAEHTSELNRREDEIRQMFMRRVKEKEAELKTAEAEIIARFEKMRNELNAKKSELEERNRQLVAQIEQWRASTSSPQSKKKKDKNKSG